MEFDKKEESQTKKFKKAMTLIKFKNESPVRNRERMPMWSEFFNDLFDDVITRPDVRRSTIPSVNVVESDENFRLEVAAPGLSKEDFKISVDHDVMTVSTEKKSESELMLTELSRVVQSLDFNNAGSQQVRLVNIYEHEHKATG